jgi:hypothetical protein
VNIGPNTTGARARPCDGLFRIGLQVEPGTGPAGCGPVGRAVAVQAKTRGQNGSYKKKNSIEISLWVRCAHDIQNKRRSCSKHGKLEASAGDGSESKGEEESHQVWSLRRRAIPHVKGRVGHVGAGGIRGETVPGSPILNRYEAGLRSGTGKSADPSWAGEHAALLSTLVRVLENAHPYVCSRTLHANRCLFYLACWQPLIHTPMNSARHMRHIQAALPAPRVALRHRFQRVTLSSSL